VYVPIADTGAAVANNDPISSITANIPNLLLVFNLFNSFKGLSQSFHRNKFLLFETGNSSVKFYNAQLPIPKSFILEYSLI
jgi:hypothetical protein